MLNGPYSRSQTERHFGRICLGIITTGAGLRTKRRTTAPAGAAGTEEERREGEEVPAANPVWTAVQSSYWSETTL